MAENQLSPSDVLPFVSMRPAAAAIDQIFGTRLAESQPSQMALAQTYQALKPKEPSLQDELLRKRIANYGEITPYQKQQLELQRQGMAQRERLAGERREQQRERQAALDEERDERRKERERLKLENKRLKYSLELKKSGLPGMMNTMQSISNVMSKYEDIPGVGSERYVPDTAYSLLGGAKEFLGMDASKELEPRQLRSALQTLKNQALREQSGAAVTTQEFKRFTKEITDMTDAELRSAMDRIRSAFAKDVQNFNAGVGPETVEAYVATGGDDILGQLEGMSFSPKNQASLEDQAARIEQQIRELEGQ